MIPRARTKIDMPCLNLILESGRKKVSIGFWKDGMRDCSEQRILSIGTEEGDTSPDVLGFSEIYFQYFIQIDHRKFVAFPIEQEAILKKGFVVTFNSKWQF